MPEPVGERRSVWPSKKTEPFVSGKTIALKCDKPITGVRRPKKSCSEQGASPLSPNKRGAESFFSFRHAAEQLQEHIKSGASGHFRHSAPPSHYEEVIEASASSRSLLNGLVQWVCHYYAST